MYCCYEVMMSSMFLYQVLNLKDIFIFDSAMLGS